MPSSARTGPLVFESRVRNPPPSRDPSMSVLRRFPDTVPRLAGETLHLRALDEDDIPAWFARASDPESAALAGDPLPKSQQDGFEWLARHRRRFREGRGIRWAIVPNDGTGSVGTVGLTFASARADAAELGIVIGRDCWGRGLGTSAVRLAAGYAFEVLGVSEIRAEFLRFNAASRRMLEKNGFRFERMLPGETQPDGQACELFVLWRTAAAQD